MVALGLFDEERIELIRGVIIAMAPNDPPHASPVQRLTKLLVLRLHDRADVRVQLPILAWDESEPEPDLAVVPVGEYGLAHPDRAHLIIEVADSSLRKDRLLKGPVYAASGFQEYWIVNVPEKVVEVHRRPSSTGWASVTRHGREETIALEAFPDVKLEIASFLS